MTLQETERKIQPEPVLPELVVYEEDVSPDFIVAPAPLLGQVVVFQAGMLEPVLAKRRKAPKQTSLSIRTREEARQEEKPRTQTDGGAKLPPPRLRLIGSRNRTQMSPVAQKEKEIR